MLLARIVAAGREGGVADISTRVMFLACAGTCRWEGGFEIFGKRTNIFKISQNRFGSR